MNMRNKKSGFALLILVLLVVSPLRGNENEIILDDDWKLWFRVGPTLGLPLGVAAETSDKLTFAYGGLVGGTLGKLPGNWAVEFVKTETTTVLFNEIAPDKQAIYNADDIQLLLSWQYPFGGRTGISPYLEVIMGGVLFTSSIEAQAILTNQAYTIGIMERQRFTYLVGAGCGASLLIGSVAGGADSRPVGVALQLYGRWLYGGPVPLTKAESGDYPILDLRHYQSVSFGFGLLFLL